MIKRKLITQDKTVAGVTSAPIATHANAAAIRAKMLQQGMQNLVTAIKMNKQQHKCIKMGGGRHYDLATIEQKGENVKDLFLNLKESATILAVTCQQVHEDRQAHVEAIRHKGSKKKYDKEYEFYTTLQSDEHREMVKQYLHNTQQLIFGEENTPPLEVKEELKKNN